MINHFFSVYFYKNKPEMPSCTFCFNWTKALNKGTSSYTPHPRPRPLHDCLKLAWNSHLSPFSSSMIRSANHFFFNIFYQSFYKSFNLIWFNHTEEWPQHRTRLQAECQRWSWVVITSPSPASNLTPPKKLDQFAERPLFCKMCFLFLSCRRGIIEPLDFPNK